MEVVLKGLFWKICFIYPDDVMVIGCTFEEELEPLKEMCEQLARAGLHLKPKKCFLFQKRVSYLGYVVTEEGIAAEAKRWSNIAPGPSRRSKVSLDLPLITTDSSLFSLP